LKGTSPVVTSHVPFEEKQSRPGQDTGFRPVFFEYGALADAHGTRRSLGPYQIGGVPEFFAKIAMERGLAIDPTSDRYKAMRAEAGRTGWPHIADEMAVRDLDRDPNAATFYNSGAYDIT
jgi:hypothetical protein